ncbi:MAG: hypothetical protein ACJAYN_003590 [Bermanella sp.]|jgi:hypothetical protein
MDSNVLPVPHPLVAAGIIHELGPEKLIKGFVPENKAGAKRSLQSLGCLLAKLLQKLFLVSSCSRYT